MKAYVNIPGGQVHYQTEGKGPPLLLLHQTSLSSEEYSEVIPILGRSHRVLAMDLPGHGNSFKPPAGFRIEDHARSVVQFLDALEVKKASIVGHHVGARIAVEVAATWAERVDRLVLSGCPWYSPEELRALATNPTYLPIRISEDGSFVMELWRTYQGRWKSQARPEVLCKLLATHLSTLARSFDIHEAATHHDIDARLRLVKVTTLIVSGSGDMFLGKMDTVRRLIPRSRTLVIGGAGFFIALEKPEAFADAILRFLRAPGI